MSDWKEIKRPFREALINGFNWNSLAMVLQYHCDRRLDRITPQSEPFDKNVDDVIDDAVRNGWLEMLAQGALEENERHIGLKTTVPHILDGVATGGTAYYQGNVFEDSRRDPAGQESDTDKPGDGSASQPIIYQVAGDLVYGAKREGDDIAVGSITDSAGLAIGRSSSASVGGESKSEGERKSEGESKSEEERKSEAVGGESAGGEVPDARQLYQQLVDQFNLEELRGLCFTLGIEFEDLGGSGKAAKARELVQYMQRRGRLDELSKAIQEQRG